MTWLGVCAGGKRGWRGRPWAQQPETARAGAAAGAAAAGRGRCEEAYRQQHHGHGPGPALLLCAASRLQVCLTPSCTSPLHTKSTRNVQWVASTSLARTRLSPPCASSLTDSLHQGHSGLLPLSWPLTPSLPSLAHPLLLTHYKECTMGCFYLHGAPLLWLCQPRLRQMRCAVAKGKGVLLAGVELSALQLTMS